MFTAPQTTSQELVVDLVITHHSGDEANAELNLYMQTQVRHFFVAKIHFFLEFSRSYMLSIYMFCIEIV